MKSKKLKALLDIYEELIQELSQFDDPFLDKVINSLSTSLKQTNEMLSDTNSPIKPSQFVSGFEQGLRDMHVMLGDLSSSIRPPALKVFYRVVVNHLPDFFQKSKAQLGRIVATGKIKNENEWYLVRNRVDEIEGQSNSEVELAVLNELLDKFETRV